MVKSKPAAERKEFAMKIAEANSWEGGMLGFACFGKISACATPKNLKNHDASLRSDS